MFVASEAAIAVKPFMIHYSMTKTAQLAVSRYVRGFFSLLLFNRLLICPPHDSGLAELTKGTRVRVNTVLPGPTWTEGVAEYISGIASQKGTSLATLLH